MMSMQLLFMSIKKFIKVDLLQSFLIVYVVISIIFSAFLLTAIKISNDQSKLNREVNRLNITLNGMLDLNFDIKKKEKTPLDTDTTGAIDKLKKMVFCEEEIRDLRICDSSLNIEGGETVKSRLNFLTSKKNKLNFTIKHAKDSKGKQFTLFSQTHPIEIDNRDLSKVLQILDINHESALSSVANGENIIIDKLSLEKKHCRGKELFLMQMELIERTFLK